MEAGNQNNHIIYGTCWLGYDTLKERYGLKRAHTNACSKLYRFSRVLKLYMTRLRQTGVEKYT